jgi:hypothetical protein
MRGGEEFHLRSLGRWSTANGDDTMVTLWNPADEAQDFVFTFFFSRGHYAWPIHLEPRATRMFNVSEVIQNQIPDTDGNVIPATVQEGSGVLNGTRGENERILVAMDVGIDNVRKATCQAGCVWCPGYSSAFLDLSPLTVGSSAQFTFTRQYSSGWQADMTKTISWSSSATNVATVNSSTSPGIGTGISPGTTNVEAFADVALYAQSCYLTPPCFVAFGLQSTQPAPVTPTVNLSCQLTDMAVGTADGTATCFTSNVAPSGGTFTWMTNDTNTISLSCTTSGCGNSDDYTAKAASTTQADTVITVTSTYNGQSATSNSKPITVHQPTSLKTISTDPNFEKVTCAIPCLAKPNSGSCAVKSGTSCSYGEQITERNYSVLDQFGNTFESVNLGAAPAITETINAQKGTCGGNGVETASTSGSPFFDKFGKCDSCCESGGPGCTSTASQKLFSNDINVRQESISETCASVTLTP